MAHKEMDILCEFYDNVLETMDDVNEKLKSGDGKIRPSDSEFVENGTQPIGNCTLDTILKLSAALECRPENLVNRA